MEKGIREKIPVKGNSKGSAQRNSTVHMKKQFRAAAT